MAAPDTVVNLDEKFAAFDELWTPKIVAQVNDLHVKIVKVQGDFVWHTHDDTDEFFMVRSGSLTIQMRGRPDAVLDAGDVFVVPKGIEHRPMATEHTEIILLEPAGLVNTGDTAPSDRTAPNDQWL